MPSGLEHQWVHLGGWLQEANEVKGLGLKAGHQPWASLLKSLILSHYEEEPGFIVTRSLSGPPESGWQASEH